jgi:hypothetical protein
VNPSSSTRRRARAGSHPGHDGFWDGIWIGPIRRCRQGRVTRIQSSLVSADAGEPVTNSATVKLRFSE